MSTFRTIRPEDITENTFQLVGTDWMLVTAKHAGKVNTMTASWGGLGIMWGKPVVFVVVRPQRYTKEFIDSSDMFSLTFFTKEYRKQLNYLGTVSGRDEDKIANSRLTLVKDINAPYFEEGKLVLKVKKMFHQTLLESGFYEESLPLKWYPNEDYHELYIAEIKEVLVK